MSKIVAIANQKGGVGKTTSARNLAHALKEAGHRVLLIDADPQGSLSLVTGIDGEELVALDESGKTLYYALTGKTPLADMIVRRGAPQYQPASVFCRRCFLRTLNTTRCCSKSSARPSLRRASVCSIRCIATAHDKANAESRAALDLFPDTKGVEQYRLIAEPAKAEAL